MIRMLGADNDHQVLQAARALVRELQDEGADLQTLADVWKVEEIKRAASRPAPPRPIDWPRVEEIVTRYAEGRTN